MAPWKERLSLCALRAAAAAPGGRVRRRNYR
uniref:Uncharacterized protein n=1 Tax=Arundo donax TaxID=35708 RepID=A0A0A9HBG3_ARUDO